MSVSNVSSPSCPALDAQPPGPAAADAQPLNPIHEFACALEFFSNAVGNFDWYGIATSLKETNNPTMVRMYWSGFEAQYPTAAKALENVWNPRC